MKYSRRFKDALKEAYPNEKNFHEMAERNNFILGRYLCDNYKGSIDLETIMEASSLEELRLIAKEEKRKRIIHNMWIKETASI